MRICVAITIALLTITAWAEQISSPARFSKVREQIQTFVDDGKVPAISVAVVQNDRLIWAQGFGFANLENADTGHSRHDLSTRVDQQIFHRHRPDGAERPRAG